MAAPRHFQAWKLTKSTWKEFSSTICRDLQVTQIYIGSILEYCVWIQDCDLNHKAPISMLLKLGTDIFMEAFFGKGTTNEIAETVPSIIVYFWRYSTFFSDMLWRKEGHNSDGWMLEKKRFSGSLPLIAPVWFCQGIVNCSKPCSSNV